MSRQYAIESVENQIAQMEAMIATRGRIQRLVQNPDFKELINKRYIVDEAASFAGAAGDSNLSKEQREDAMEMARAPGHLKRWFTVQIAMANKAEDDLKQVKHARDVLVATSDEDFDNNNYSFEAEDDDSNTP